MTDQGGIAYSPARVNPIAYVQLAAYPEGVSFANYSNVRYFEPVDSDEEDMPQSEEHEPEKTDVSVDRPRSPTAQETPTLTALSPAPENPPNEPENAPSPSEPASPEPTSIKDESVNVNTHPDAKIEESNQDGEDRNTAEEGNDAPLPPESISPDPTIANDEKAGTDTQTDPKDAAPSEDGGSQEVTKERIPPVESIQADQSSHGESLEQHPDRQANEQKATEVTDQSTEGTEASLPASTEGALIGETEDQSASAERAVARSTSAEDIKTQPDKQDTTEPAAEPEAPTPAETTGNAPAEPTGNSEGQTKSGLDDTPIEGDGPPSHVGSKSQPTGEAEAQSHPGEETENPNSVEPGSQATEEIGIQSTPTDSTESQTQSVEEIKPSPPIESGRVLEGEIELQSTSIEETEIQDKPNENTDAPPPTNLGNESAEQVEIQQTEEPEASNRSTEESETQSSPIADTAALPVESERQPTGEADTLHPDEADGRAAANEGTSSPIHLEDQPAEETKVQDQSAGEADLTAVAKTDSGQTDKVEDSPPTGSEGQLTGEDDQKEADALDSAPIIPSQQAGDAETDVETPPPDKLETQLTGGTDVQPLGDSEEPLTKEAEALPLTELENTPAEEIQAPPADEAGSQPTQDTDAIPLATSDNALTGKDEAILSVDSVETSEDTSISLPAEPVTQSNEEAQIERSVGSDSPSTGETEIPPLDRPEDQGAGESHTPLQAESKGTPAGDADTTVPAEPEGQEIEKTEIQPPIEPESQPDQHSTSEPVSEQASPDQPKEAHEQESVELTIESIPVAGTPEAPKSDAAELNSTTVPVAEISEPPDSDTRGETTETQESDQAENSADIEPQIVTTHDEPHEDIAQEEPEQVHERQDSRQQNAEGIDPGREEPEPPEENITPQREDSKLGPSEAGEISEKPPGDSKDHKADIVSIAEPQSQENKGVVDTQETEPEQAHFAENSDVKLGQDTETVKEAVIEPTFLETTPKSAVGAAPEGGLEQLDSHPADNEPASASTEPTHTNTEEAVSQGPDGPKEPTVDIPVIEPSQPIEQQAEAPILDQQEPSVSEKEANEVVAPDTSAPIEEDNESSPTLVPVSESMDPLIEDASKPTGAEVTSESLRQDTKEDQGHIEVTKDTESESVVGPSEAEGPPENLGETRNTADTIETLISQPQESGSNSQTEAEGRIGVIPNTAESLLKSSGDIEEAARTTDTPRETEDTSQAEAESHIKVIPEETQGPPEPPENMGSPSPPPEDESGSQVEVDDQTKVNPEEVQSPVKSLEVVDNATGTTETPAIPSENEDVNQTEVGSQTEVDPKPSEDIPAAPQPASESTSGIEAENVSSESEKHEHTEPATEEEPLGEQLLAVDEPMKEVGLTHKDEPVEEEPTEQGLAEEESPKVEEPTPEPDNLVVKSLGDLTEGTDTEDEFVIVDKPTEDTLNETRDIPEQQEQSEKELSVESPDSPTKDPVETEQEPLEQLSLEEREPSQVINPETPTQDQAPMSDPIVPDPAQAPAENVPVGLAQREGHDLNDAIKKPIEPSTTSAPDRTTPLHPNTKDEQEITEVHEPNQLPNIPVEPEPEPDSGVAVAPIEDEAVPSDKKEYTSEVLHETIPPSQSESEEAVVPEAPSHDERAEEHQEPKDPSLVNISSNESESAPEPLPQDVGDDEDRNSHAVAKGPQPIKEEPIVVELLEVDQDPESNELTTQQEPEITHLEALEDTASMPDISPAVVTEEPKDTHEEREDHVGTTEPSVTASDKQAVPNEQPDTIAQVPMESPNEPDSELAQSPSAFKSSKLSISPIPSTTILKSDPPDNSPLNSNEAGKNATQAPKPTPPAPNSPKESTNRLLSTPAPESGLQASSQSDNAQAEPNINQNLRSIREDRPTREVNKKLDNISLPKPKAKSPKISQNDFSLPMNAPPTDNDGKKSAEERRHRHRRHSHHHHRHHHHSSQQRDSKGSGEQLHPRNNRLEGDPWEKVPSHRSAPPAPKGQDSGFSLETARTSYASSRKQRTPEEQAAHERRKEERRAARKAYERDLESKGKDLEIPPSDRHSSYRSSRRHSISHPEKSYSENSRSERRSERSQPEKQSERSYFERISASSQKRFFGTKNSESLMASNHVPRSRANSTNSTPPVHNEPSRSGGLKRSNTSKSSHRFHDQDESPRKHRSEGKNGSKAESTSSRTSPPVPKDEHRNYRREERQRAREAEAQKKTTGFRAAIKKLFT